MANLDGSGERQITNGSLGAGYAGYTRDAAGNVELYYTSEVALTGGDNEVSPPAGGKIVVYRTVLDNGPSEELFDFPATAKHDEFYSTFASISPDGNHLAYADGVGVHRLDLEMARNVTLLTNAPCNSNDSAVVSTCRVYGQPHWSPYGDLLLLLKFYYEGAQPVVIHPLNADVAPLELGDRSEYDDATWSPDGQRLCLVPFNAHKAVQVAEAGGSQLVDLEPKLRSDGSIPASARVYGWRCAWAPDGRLAMQYMLSNEELPRHLAVFNSSLAFQSEIRLPEPARGASIVIGWLPDGTGLLMQNTSDDPSQTAVSAVTLDGTARSLPFVANQVLAVLP